MLEQYLNWPRQVRDSLSKWGTWSVRGDFTHVAVFGMGGSGVVGDYLALLSLESGKYPVIVVKSHIVPSYVGEKTLAIVVSYSGNTIETIMAFENLLKSGATIAVVSSGGVLKTMAQERGVTYVEVPKGLAPRASLPSMLYSTLGLLDSSGYTLVSKSAAENSAEFLEEKVSEAVEAARDLSKWLYEEAVRAERLPVVVTHSPLEAIAIRFKNELNENSKIVVKVDIAPECMHNDVVGYEAPTTRRLAVLEVVDPSNEVGTKLVDFMRSIYSEHDAAFYRLAAAGRNVLEKAMYLSLVAGLASVMLAEMRGLDPAATKSIAMYKKKAAEIFS
ncbi:MAG: bifunctional phosphoglucose/phosphomannose isomerase [Desulfurococcaceae archaeon]